MVLTRKDFFPAIISNNSDFDTPERFRVRTGQKQFTVFFLSVPLTNQHGVILSRSWNLGTWTKWCRRRAKSL